MAYEFTFPDVGEGIHEGKIVKWLVQEGDEVKADHPLTEVETDKAIVEIPSPKSGKVVKITHQEGDVIKVGEVLAILEIESEEQGGEEKPTAESAQKDESQKQEKTEEKRESTGVVGSLETTAPEVMKAPGMNASGAVFAKQQEQKSEPAPADTGENPASPEAKAETEKTPAETKPEKVSEESQTASSQKTKGIGVVKSGLKQVKKFDFFGYIDRAPYSGIRKSVGEHMVKSMYTIPHVTHTDMADVTELWELREKEKAAAKKAGTKLTFLPFFVKAVTAALTKHPYLNAELNEEEGVIILKKYYNIGIAVDTEDGLMVPVIKGADKKSVIDLAKEIVTLAEKAREKKINPMDMKGGSFTITNIGSAGSGWFATPVIRYPEAAILGTGMIQDMPVAKDGKVVVRKMLPLSVAFDHRILDGAEAARFTVTLKEHLEYPGLLLVEEK